MNNPALRLGKTLLLLAMPSLCLISSVRAEDDSDSFKKGDRIIIVNYSALSRNADEQDLDSHNIGLTYVEKLSGDRAQYFTLSGNRSDFNSTDEVVDIDTLSASYVHMWNGLQPGLSVFAGAFASRNWSDYDLGTAPDGGRFSHGGGLGALGGVVQYIPLSDKLVLAGSATVSIGRGLVDDLPREHNRLNVTLSPNAQLTYAVQPDLLLSANIGAMISNNYVSLSDNKTLGQVGAGIKYTVGDYTFDVNYSHEFVDDHVGNRIGFSIARKF